MNKAIRLFKSYIESNIRIRKELNQMAGWTTKDFNKLMALLEKGERANREHLKELVESEKQYKRYGK